MSALGECLLRSAREARAIARGEAEPARVFVTASVDLAAVRRTEHWQGRFAQRFGLSLAAIRDREQNRRTPDPAARTLPMVIDREEAVEWALAREAA